MGTLARFIVDMPSQNPDLFYACGFDAPDPCIFFAHRGRRYLLLSDLEFDRGAKTAKVDRVLPMSRYAALERERGGRGSQSDVIAAVCRERKISMFDMPASTAVGLVDQLRAKKLRVRVIANPFFPQRLLKTPAELRALRKAQRTTLMAIDLVARILRASTIGRCNVLQWHGKPLTTERVKAEVTALLIAQGFSCPYGMIIASGNDATEPHNMGSGVLRAHESIIVDIFPRHDTTMMYGDATRTFCRGRASDELTKMYAAVQSAQRAALQTIRAGVDGSKVHHAVQQCFATAGFTTGELRGRRQGFIHGTGHGLGLALHEEPVRINANAFTLRAGHVVTVEPGLYYRGVGGVRLEDVVVVTKTGCELLARYPKRLQV